MSEDAFEKHFLGGKQDINIGTLTDYVLGVQNELIRARNPWGHEDLRKAIEKKFQTSELSLSGLVKVVKGEKPSVGLTHDQFETIYALYGITGTDAVGDHVLFATIASPDGSKVERARLILLFNRIPADQIVISKGLAEALGVSGKDEEIKILDITEDITDLNLDSRIR